MKLTMAVSLLVAISAALPDAAPFAESLPFNSFPSRSAKGTVHVLAALERTDLLDLFLLDLDVHE